MRNFRYTAALIALAACHGSSTGPGDGGTHPPPPPPALTVALSSNIDSILRTTLTVSVETTGGVGQLTYAFRTTKTTLCTSFFPSCRFDPNLLEKDTTTFSVTVTDTKGATARVEKKILVGVGPLITMPVDPSGDKLVCGPPTWVSRPDSLLGLSLAPAFGGIQYCLPQNGLPARPGIWYASQYDHLVAKSDTLKYTGTYSIPGSGFTRDSTKLYFRLVKGAALSTTASTNWSGISRDSTFTSSNTFGSEATSQTYGIAPLFIPKASCVSTTATATVKNFTLTFIQSAPRTTTVQTLKEHTLTLYPCS